MRWMSFLALLVGAACPATARAELILRVDDVVMDVPTTVVGGFFDVFFQIVEPDPGRNGLAGYEIALDLTPASAGVSFELAENPATPHPPVFPSSPPSNFGSTASRIQATAFLFSGSTTIDDDEGLIRVPFQVAAETSGEFNVTIDLENTALGDSFAQPISFTPVDGTIRIGVEPASVVGRYVAYGNSSFDVGGSSPGIATDKAPHFADGAASFANYTSFDRGINRIVIDVENLADHENVDLGDFVFRVGNESDTSTWVASPPANQVVVHQGAGVGNSDRIVVDWPDLAIQNQWLEVTVKAGQDTGLTQDDVFYFGNAVGETGNQGNNALVTAADIVAARDHPRGPGNRAPITDPFDFDRNQLVDSVDMVLARNHVTSPWSALRLIGPPASPAPMATTTVPEPSSLLLSGFVLLLTVGWLGNTRRIRGWRFG